MAGTRDARCPRHPDQPAQTTCGRCGRFVCTTCVNFERDQVFCDECYQREHAGKASSRAVTALVLAIIGFNCMPFLGIPALLMANAELDAIARGEAPRKGANLASGARILAWLEIALLAAAGVGVAMLFASGFWKGFTRGTSGGS